MRIVEPQVFLIAETKIDQNELDAYLKEIGAEDWRSDAGSDSEKLVEVGGRLCYRSFKPGLNPNVKKIRERNDEYLTNVIKSKHGSVFEHAVLNFIFLNVSRVFTHELVRHRVGVAISQESLRYVRLDKLNFWMPLVFRNHPKSEMIAKFVTEKVELMERWQLELAEILGIENETKFEVKKKLTSAMRRIAPIGLATAILWSANHRTLRHVLEMRTDPGAEEEIRLVFGKVGEILAKRYPNIYADFTVTIEDGLPCWRPAHSKI